ncbi:Sporulation factor SpoIIGA [Desulfosporosinus orientis DSM 765]|uniref:Sporulation sigma-E factor-processing peptidase n=1 Tax=Desulfosporosinus orientis (strain ATCC 19365 / DSM 765 / NCIMB 8382 / VKM B-1628 / Singapore I) TaxID=768706 RepID=G7WHC0_DESOD|nr:sigma-E processing peptidase SpoIIGA [Desulfosporosinus orientis]AET70210.1 Sporulation factor SpoIIGA [Desulfosporosinus orientis DSM 765]
MSAAETYLDLVILINGGMDALVLVLLGKLLHLPSRPMRIITAALVGEIPVLLACYSISPWTTISKWLIPFLMVIVAYPTKRPGTFLKALVGFWLLSAGLGGFMYGLWGWTKFDDGLEKENLILIVHDLWVLPLGALLWWLLQNFWQRWQERKAMLERTIYDLEICFGGEENGTVHIKALLDTGNDLRDPLTGSPVILLEEEAAAKAIPASVKAFMDIPWKDCPDPWPLLWKLNPNLIKRLVFIPFQTIDAKSWLLGIRPEHVTFCESKESRQIHATVALVKQVLSLEGEYQALLHPEHVQKGGDG